MRVLHLEDSNNDAEIVAYLLTGEWPDCVIERVADRTAYTAALVKDGFDIILSDYALPSYNGLAALQLARERCPSTPFIFVSGTIGEERAIEALKAGAFDYVIKDRPGRLVPAVRRALETHAREKSHRVAERRLREQAALLDKARDAIIATDLDYRVTYWNGGAERLHGRTAVEVIGCDLRSLGLGHDPLQFAAARARLLAHGEWRGGFRIRDRAGRVRHIESSWSLVRGTEGDALTILAIETDVSERKLLEAQLLQSQRVESIGMLAGGIAHDLNNVLAPILMGIELLRLSHLSPAERTTIHAMEASAQHGSNLVRQLLAFARGARGERVPAHLRPLLRDLRTLLEPALPGAISVEVVDQDDLRPVLADGTQLKQVLLNLCINARDAMPHGGSIRIQAENTEVDAALARACAEARPGPHVRISVIDTGAGIPPEVLDRIFEPFFTTKEIGRGTGLGLPLVRGIVREHDGFLTVESEVGRGTTMRIYLPALNPEVMTPADATATPVANVRGQGELILIADDDAAIRQMLTTLLEHVGYRVVSVADGIEGLEQFRAHAGQVALVVTDMVMRRMAGSEFIRALRELDPALGIVTVSGMRFDPDPAVAAALTKPIETTLLLDTIHRAIGTTR